MAGGLGARDAFIGRRGVAGLRGDTVSTGIRARAIFLGLLLACAGESRETSAQIITTYAGGPGVERAPTGVALDGVAGTALDADGNLYIADAFNNVVRKLGPSGMVVVAGNGTADFAGDGGPATLAEIDVPYAVAVDAHGNLYIAESQGNRIRKVDVAGTITTIAGTGSPGYGGGGDGGPATLAGLWNPVGVAVDNVGNVFISDTANNRIRKVDTSGVISTVAGTGASGFSGDGGPATAATLGQPWSLAFDASGNLYVADLGNDRIRKIDPSGIISTVAGGGNLSGSDIGDGGPATSAELAGPYGVSFDGLGNMYITGGWNVVRRVDSTGIITTVAGTQYITNDGGCYVLGWTCFGGDGGPAAQAIFYGPGYVTADPSGQLYVSDVGNNRVRKVDGTHTINTVVGDGTQAYSGDDGAARLAQFNRPIGLTVDASGVLYVADSQNEVIRAIGPDGNISTIAGVGPGPSYVFSGGYSGDGGLATAAELHTPSGVARDAAGNLYVADTHNSVIRKIDAAGVISTFAGSENSGYAGDGGPAVDAQLSYPNGVAVDGDGNVLIADTSNAVIRRVDTKGVITTVAGNGQSGFSGDGGPATIAELGAPFGVAADTPGNLYIADFGNDAIRKVDTSGVMTTIAGRGDDYSNGIPAVAAELWAPSAVVVDADGVVYFAEKENHDVRKIDLKGRIWTVAGFNRTWGFSGDGGPATNAEMSATLGIALDGSGNLFIADSDNGRIRKLMLDQIFGNSFEQAD